MCSVSSFEFLKALSGEGESLVTVLVYSDLPERGVWRDNYG